MAFEATTTLVALSKTLRQAHREPGWGARFVFEVRLSIILIPNEHVVSVLAISITTVALAEIGDKAWLYPLLASRYRKPIPIIAAIFFATIANHALAAWLGVVVADHLSPEVLKWVLVVSFIAMAGWILIPGKLDDDEQISNRGRLSPVSSLSSFARNQVMTPDCDLHSRGSIFGCINVGNSRHYHWYVAGGHAMVIIGKLSADKMPLDLIRKIWPCYSWVWLSQRRSIKRWY